MANVVAAMLFGLLSTIILHIAKAMERQGIDIFAQMRNKIRKSDANPSTPENPPITKDDKKLITKAFVDEGAKKPMIYIVGLILNNTVFLWMMLSNTFAPPSYFTSMFGVGLIALMLYSTKVLKEDIKKIEYIGAAILLTGTLVLGIEGIYRPEMNMADVNTSLVWLIFGIFLGLGILMMILSYKTHSTLMIGIAFGLFAGGCGCMDPFFKGIGQSAGGISGFLPVTPAGWVIFLISFGVGAAAFWLTQVGYMKQAAASVLVPCYNSMYIVFPILVSYFVLPGFTVSGVTFLGIGLTVLGIILMQAFKPMKAPIHK